MSTRRIATNQPESFAFSAESEAQVKTWLAKYPEDRKQSAVIPVLWIAQAQSGGWLPEPAMRVVADMLGMAYIRVYEVATFYTMFNLAPVGRHHVQLCGTTPCMLRGAQDLRARLEERIGAEGTVSGDGVFSWIEVECLGACCNAPMAQISNAEGHHYYEDLTPELLDKVLDELAAGRAPAAGPQIERQTSAPVGGPATLTEPALYDGSRAQPETIPNAARMES